MTFPLFLFDLNHKKGRTLTWNTLFFSLLNIYVCVSLFHFINKTNGPYIKKIKLVKVNRVNECQFYFFK
jgi:hypothetical protein